MIKNNQDAEKEERDRLRAEKAVRDAMLRGGLPAVLELILELYQERERLREVVDRKRHET